MRGWTGVLESEGTPGGRVWPIRAPAMTLGRDPGSDVVLDDPAASWHHARLLSDGADVVLEDFGSTNGTWVNGQRLAGRRALVPGDLIRCGTTALRLRVEERRPFPDAGGPPARPPDGLGDRRGGVPPRPAEAVGDATPAAVPVNGAPRVEVHGDRRARDVAAITGSGFFQQVLRVARRRRGRAAGGREDGGRGAGGPPGGEGGASGSEGP